MVPRVPERMAPEDRVAFHEKEPRHRPGVAHSLAGGMPIQGSARPCQPDPQSEHLAFSALSDPEGGIEPPWGIGHGPGLRPVAFEERRTLGNRSLIDEQNRRICGVGLAGSA
jgi:hypothetical protein